MNLKIVGSLLFPVLLGACTVASPDAPTTSTCPPSSVPTNALEASVLKQTEVKAACTSPESICTYTIRRGKDAALIVDVAFQQLDESKTCFMAGDAVSAYLFDAKGNFVREAHGGLSVEVASDEAVQATDAGL